MIAGLLVGVFLSLQGFISWYNYNEVIPLTINPNYTGFGIVHNFSRTYVPDNFHLVHYVQSPYLRSELRFYFDYIIEENGTFVVAFLLPFKIYSQLTSDLEYNVTETGSIVWTTVTHENVLMGSRVSGRIEGYFRIGHTFIQGKRGQYLAIFPYWVNLHGQGIQDLQKKYGLHSTSLECRVEIDYLTKLDYALMDSAPEFTIFPRYNKWNQKPVIGVSWEFTSEPKTVVLQFESQTEIDRYSKLVHWSGIYLGIGLPLVIQGYNVILKEGIEKFPFESLIRITRVVRARVDELLSELRKKDDKKRSGDSTLQDN